MVRNNIHIMMTISRVDMDRDGKITFEEIIHELTHCVVGTIEERLKIPVEEKIHQLEAGISSPSINQKISTSDSIDRSEKHTVSPNLITYLYDSFQAADTDLNGKLDNNEFWNIIRTVLSLSEGDRELLEV